MIVKDCIVMDIVTPVLLMLFGNVYMCVLSPPLSSWTFMQRTAHFLGFTLSEEMWRRVALHSQRAGLVRVKQAGKGEGRPPQGIGAERRDRVE